MTDKAQYVSAEARYTALKTDRSQAESRAKQCAAVTLPKLWKEPGQKTDSASSRKTPYQGTGARCVNSLSARLLLAMFPPNAAPFKLSPDGFDMAKIEEQVGIQQGELEAGLAEIERTVINDIETSGMRPVLGEAMKHAICPGNFLLYVPDEGAAKMYPLSRYVVDKDGMGNVLEIVTLDSVAIDSLEDSVKAAVGLKEDQGSSSSSGPAKEADLYTRIARQGELWVVNQEINGKPVPGSDGSYPIDACPWIPFAFSPEWGSSYGVGLVWDYIGDLKSLEALSKALLKAAAAAAKILWTLNPNSAIRSEQITQAESGAVLRMNKADLQAVGLDKYADIQFARQQADTLVNRLELVFGVRTAIQRSGERVTAEEIRYLAQELEDSLGNLYSAMAEELLLPLVRRVLDRLTKARRIPQLPPGIVKPRITVGMAALGRGQDMRKLIEWAQAAESTVGEQVFAQRLNVGEYLARLGAASDLSMKGLLKTDADLQAEQQNNSLHEGLVRAAPQLAQSITQPQETTPQ